MSHAFKYKVRIDDKHKNDSHNYMISFVNENSKVLDLGCACGDIGKYLYDHKNCEVVGIDYDEQSIKVAQKTKAYQEIIRIDLNDDIHELERFKGYFDCIIIGDVLEHLNHPKEVLSKLTKLINEDGYVIVSLPNITHGSIKINLLKNRFRYTETGLLDHTHIRFFTKESIADLFKSAKLIIEKIEEVFAPFEGTIENAKKRNLPREVIRFLENDHESNVYQYVVKAYKTKSHGSPSNTEAFKEAALRHSKIRIISGNRARSLKKKIRKLDERFFFSILSKIKNRCIANWFSANAAAIREYVSSIIELPNDSPQDYIEFSANSKVINKGDVKAIAFYLPQFHPIAENDTWWGKSFTEWTNVTKAVPQFLSHYQPRLPGDLGFYDLRLAEIQKEQIELARNYGIYGFCFHYYWFSGKRLLEKPIFQYLSHNELDFPFCLCWANENWTRRWDASENLVLMPQNHHREDDLRFIQDIEPFFRDSRYIRVNGKIILIVYRIHLFQKENVLRMTDAWRKYCKENGLGELFLVAAQTHGFLEDPRDWGFDAAVEFPPHNFSLPIINRKIEIVNPNFVGYIYDFKQYLREKPYLNKTPFVLFKTVFPEWDNTPRMNNRGHIFYGAGRETYKEWLTDAIKFTVQNYSSEERLVFINAWNEWAEGAYIEPDRKNGYSYLQITYDCLKNS